MAFMAGRWPTLRYWMVAHESNLDFFYSAGDVVGLVDEIRASALAAYYANPEAVIVAPGLAQWPTKVSVPGEYITYEHFLQSLYDLGFRKYVDVVSLHPFLGWAGSVERTVAEVLRFVDDVRAIMERNGDSDGLLWSTGHGWGTGAQNEGLFVREDVRAELLVAAFRALAMREDVSASLVYNFWDEADLEGQWDDFTGFVEHELNDGAFVPKLAYWAVREFLTGQLPP